MMYNNMQFITHVYNILEISNIREKHVKSICTLLEWMDEKKK